jgi:riboflavin kinase / FMN adenylyltransferase
VRVLDSIEDLSAALGPEAASAATIGVFDGLHLGHQALIRKTVEIARARRLLSLVITFAAHPLSVLAPPYCPKKLIYPERKVQFLADLGIDVVARIPFTVEFSQLSPADFVEQLLVRTCGVREVVCGYDFSFGRSGAGNMDLLRELGERDGFDVRILDAVTDHGVFVKSTMVRDMLFSGQVNHAARLLLHPYELQGEVATGFGRGREIGFPTANLAVDGDHVIPARGVYLCAAVIHGEPEVHGSMVNIGYNPTFGHDRLSIEAHLFDTDRDLVGERLSLFFLRRLRDERKFESAQALADQLHHDRDESHRLLGSPETAALMERVRKTSAAR